MMATASRPMERGETEEYLARTYRLTGDQAAALVAESTASVSGMAPYPRPGEQTVWVIHMVTLGGKFIVDAEWPAPGPFRSRTRS